MNLTTTGPNLVTPNADVQKGPRLELAWETTHPVDDVFILSSVPGNIGAWPCPRVLKRSASGSTYMTPRSPESPTLHAVSERKRRRLGNMRQKEVAQYVPRSFFPAPIPHIEAINFGKTVKCSQLDHQSVGMDGSKIEDKAKIYAFVAPDTSLASKFNPLNMPSHKLQGLDAAHAQGLSPKAFWELFARCTACMNFMTARSVEQHICPDTRGNSSTAPPILLSDTYFLWLLDAYHDGSSGGVTRNVFEQIFFVCDGCGSHMTQRGCKYHRCNEPSGIEEFPPWDFEPPFTD